MPKNWSPTDLESAIAAKDKEAFDEAFSPFYLEEQKALLSYARKNYSLSKEEISDLIQDSFVECTQACWAEKITDFGNLGGYTMGIFQNLLHAHLRKKQKLPTDSLGEEGQEIAEPAKPIEEPDREEAFARCFQQLGESCQQILRLKMAKKSMREIADTLGLKNADVARSTKVRCMKKLTICLTA